MRSNGAVDGGGGCDDDDADGAAGMPALCFPTMVVWNLQSRVVLWRQLLPPVMMGRLCLAFEGFSPHCMM